MGTFQPPPPVAPGDGTAAARTLGLPSGLPGARALIGGVLVAVALLGTYVLAAGASGRPTGRVVVATVDAGAGRHLRGEDLRVVETDLGGELREGLFDDATSLVGATTLGPIGAGEPIARSQVALPGPASASLPAFRELSFGLDRDHAVGGELRRGDRVDVVATLGSGDEARTDVVVRDAVVTAVDLGAKSSIGTTGRVVLTLALPTEADVLAVAHALEVGKVTLVRSTDARRDAAPTPTPTAPGTTVRPSSSTTAATAPVEPARSDPPTIPAPVLPADETPAADGTPTTTPDPLAAVPAPPATP